MQNFTLRNTDHDDLLNGQYTLLQEFWRLGGPAVALQILM